MFAALTPVIAAPGGPAALPVSTAATQGVFSYFFQAGFALALGIALVTIPAYRFATRKKAAPLGQKYLKKNES